MYWFGRFWVIGLYASGLLVHNHVAGYYFAKLSKYVAFDAVYSFR